MSIATLKIGIVHISDIHINDATVNLSAKFLSLKNAIRSIFFGCKIIVLVISGDIACNGKREEYEVAFEYMTDLKMFIETEYAGVLVKYVIVPGNHDCNFEHDNQVRQTLLKTINYGNIGDDNSVVNTCLNVQDGFWNFYGQFSALPSDRLYYEITEEIESYRICFHCFNTAWASQIKEVPGSLFFPVEKYSKTTSSSQNEIDISVYHHPVAWFSPNTNENNRREFQSLLERISSLQLSGHEHESELRKSVNMYMDNTESFSASGNVFDASHNTNVSGFKTIIIECNSTVANICQYFWDGNIFKTEQIKELSLMKKTNQRLKVNSTFIKHISQINIPLINNKISTTLTDYFVYPELESLSSGRNEDKINYIDSETLINSEQNCTYILEGDYQIGKTSLLNMLYLRFYDMGLFPLLINGDDISISNPNLVIERSFRNQYTSESIFDEFAQLPKERKILLIDDYHNCKQHRSITTQYFDYASHVFGRVIITMYTTFGAISQLYSFFRNAKIYSIKPFGHKKRNSLVNRYIESNNTADNNIEKFDQTKELFDRLDNVLGKKLIPSYPIFILTILQTFDQTSLNTNETSFGYCYHTLIHLAFQSAGVTNNEMDSYFNFASELAFAFYKEKLTSITDGDLDEFYKNYCKRFVAPSLDDLKSKLINSKIIKYEFGIYEFSYVYILYFLASKKIAEIIETKEGKDIVTEMFQCLQDEQVANILIFTTHHTKNSDFIQESIFNIMLPFEETKPITLKANCQYYALLRRMVQDVKQAVIEQKDPENERNKLLEEKDTFDRYYTDESEDNEKELNEKIYPFIRAYRTIEIIGQIVKNRKGSIEIPILKEMITQLYLSGFRMIGYFGSMINSSMASLIEGVEEKVDKNDSNIEIEKKSYEHILFFSLSVCLGVFSKMICSVGVGELHALYNTVAEEINTPAAKLVSFSINTYYGKLNMKELNDLAKEFKNNPVAFEILRSRVYSYMNYNYVDYKLKQQIASALGIRFVPQSRQHDVL